MDCVAFKVTELHKETVNFTQTNPLTGCHPFTQVTRNDNVSETDFKRISFIWYFQIEDSHIEDFVAVVVVTTTKFICKIIGRGTSPQASD
jgi:hypothetical protein